MHSNDKHLFVIRTIEDADPAAFWKTARAAPKKIMLEFLGAGLLETVNLAPLGVDTDMTCRMAPSFPAPSIP